MATTSSKNGVLADTVSQAERLKRMRELAAEIDNDMRAAKKTTVVKT